jgi:RNA polymerase sigma-70 factor (ECF subfamily)
VASTPDPLRHLVEPAARGDARALRELLGALAPAVLRTARALLGRDRPEVEDVTQESLTAIVAALPKYRGDARVTHYCNRITVRTALRYRKRMRKTAEREADAADQGAPGIDPTASDEGLDHDPDARLQARRRAACLRELIAALPDAQAEAMTMRLVLGYDLPEISEATGASTNTVRSRVRLGREKLRALIDADPRARAILALEKATVSS